MSTKIGLFYGTTNGNTGDAAKRIQQALNELAPNTVETIFDVANADVKKMLDYDALILGSSTWNIGELQYDWDDAMNSLNEMDLSGKKRSENLATYSSSRSITSART
jgi:flavodoxin